MRLRELQIENFGCIGSPGYTVEIDNIVVLIGANNVGKSTVFDAYEAFASIGAPLSIEQFHNLDPEVAVEVRAKFTDLTEEDKSVLGGEKWVFEDQVLGPAIHVKFRWSVPEERGKKYSWDPASEDWILGGVGGWDTLIKSRIPVPMRVRPSDDASDTEDKIVEILTSAVKESFKAREKTNDIEAKLRDLSEELCQAFLPEVDRVTGLVSEKLASVFAGHKVEFQADLGEVKPEKIFGAGSKVIVTPPAGQSIALGRQGAGMQRTFFWTALGTLAEVGHYKSGKARIDPERPRILLMEEPEAFLHPPMIRSARESLYALAETETWQVIASTHSPIFIDVAKPHTTIVRVDRDEGGSSRVLSTERISFTEDERKNLTMVRLCNPLVCEFFFADRAVLVEGETESIALAFLLNRSGDARSQGLAVVNCIGKGNLPTFARILNQFGMSYCLIHDSDAPRSRRKGSLIRNGMWTINQRIADAIAECAANGGDAHSICHVPDFEGYYFGTSLSGDKPTACQEQLARDDFDTADELSKLRALAETVLDPRASPMRWDTLDQLKSRVEAWAIEAQPDDPELWQLSDDA
ncbi:AAA family ATPase [Cyanobium sp. Candia 9D4]|uniref:ATP-dependent nuclease n=1 Tax=Cyanobium sp. Candia 9D4 TaxID=2823707 RepID=UPI0020CDC52F|nr:AAA family ATPase [Cyanobium sp. Candia 9D4]MCP9932444.1 AAA family ATPase [Cyanobium sp. Candia 9D4]